MLASCSRHRVGTVYTCLSPVRPPKIEISKKKFFDRKTKMLASLSGYRVGTVDTSLSPFPLEIEISKVLLIKKRKCLHPVQGTALIPLSPPFHRCNLQKSRYRRKLFGPKNDNAFIMFRAPLKHRWYLPFTFATPRNRNIEEKIFTEKQIIQFKAPRWQPFTCTSPRNRDIEKKFGSKDKNVRILFRVPRWYGWHLPFTCASPSNRDIKSFLDQKTKMFAYGSGHHVNTAVTSLSPVQPPKIEISKKHFWTEKKMVAHCLGHLFSIVDTSLLPVQTPEIEILKKIFLDRKTKMFARIQFRAPRWNSWHLSFICTSPRNRDIEETFFGQKNEYGRTLFSTPRWR